MVVFPKVFADTANAWADDAVVLITGRVDRRDDAAQLLCETVHAWDDAVRMGPLAYRRGAGPALARARSRPGSVVGSGRMATGTLPRLAPGSPVALPRGVASPSRGRRAGHGIGEPHPGPTGGAGRRVAGAQRRRPGPCRRLGGRGAAAGRRHDLHRLRQRGGPRTAAAGDRVADRRHPRPPRLAAGGDQHPRRRRHPPGAPPAPRRVGRAARRPADPRRRPAAGGQPAGRRGRAVVRLISCRP